MRRMILLAMLLAVLTSCYYRPVFVEGRPPVQTGVGSVPPKPSQQMRTGSRGVQYCREISRARCDVVTCKGKSLDLVTLSCGGSQVTRCELGKGGC